MNNKMMEHKAGETAEAETSSQTAFDKPIQGEAARQEYDKSENDKARKMIFGGDDRRDGKHAYRKSGHLLHRVFHVLTKRQKRVMVILFAMMVVGAALETIGTSLILPLITAATSPESVSGNKYMRMISEHWHLESVNQFLILIIIALIIVFIAKNLYLFFMYYAQYRFVYNGQYNTSRVLFKEILHRPYEFFLDASTPLVIQHIVSDVNGTYNLILTYLQLFTELIVFVFLIALSLAVSPVMTLMMGFFIGLVLLINRKFFSPMLRRFGQEVKDNQALQTKWLLQSMNGIKETKVLNKEHYFASQFEISAGRLNQIQQMQQTFSNVPRLSIETVMIVGILAMLGIFLGSGSESGTGSMIGQVGVLAMVAVRIMPSANRVVSCLNNISYYEPAFLDVEDIIQHAHTLEKEKHYENEENAEPIRFTKEVKLEDITYHYPGKEDVDILKNASLIIPKGKSIGLVGPSGAGKSTTVDLILGLLAPQAGKITVDGEDIRNNLSGWYKDIGYVPQLMYMLDDTIRRNVAYGVPDDQIDDEKVWKALKQAQIDDFVRSQKYGLDSGIGERGVRISGGQRQRIGIARALYNDPEIMIFDEATSALDNDTETAIMEAIEALHGKKTLIIVAHRLTTIQNCDYVYRVDHQGFTLQEDLGRGQPLRGQAD
ncbi:MAG: ABC transporter ATP-binding protein [Lachnospiraceae bacterium]|nr:ABC transporter ATP-binding protein [Lachnospiraceae bacterium]